tara:strand:- start:1055 stop:2476 length:1422 start_codon:yes stop_codon:yes gene_type:complete
MNFKGILFYLGIYSFVVGFFSILNIFYSLYFNFLLDLGSYYYCLAISFSVGLILSFIGRKFSKNLNLYDQLFLSIIGFFFIPLLISIPFNYSIHNFSFMNSYFESISGFSCTGFSIIQNLDNINQPLLIWRSSSQWLGGIFYLVTIVSVLGNRKIKINPSYLVNQDFDTSNFYYDFFGNCTKIIIPYLVLSSFVFFLMMFSGVRFFDGFNLTLSIISAGGFLTQNNLSDIIKNDLQILILSITLIFPILNIYFFPKALINKFQIREFFEDFYLITILLIFLTFFYFVSDLDESFAKTLLVITSSFSTSGIAFQDMQSNYYFLLITLTILGGSALSTSSGLKFIRVYVLFKHAMTELSKASRPLNIINKKLFYGHLKVQEDDENISFFIFITFLLLLFILAGLLTVGVPDLENAFTLSILTLTNTLASSIYNLSDLNFFNLNHSSKISLIIFMILGKFELLGVLILFKKFIIRE